jgi:hypothetical protein
VAESLVTEAAVIPIFCAWRNVGRASRMIATVALSPFPTQRTTSLRSEARLFPGSVLCCLVLSISFSRLAKSRQATETCRGMWYSIGPVPTIELPSGTLPCSRPVLEFVSKSKRDEIREQREMNSGLIAAFSGSETPLLRQWRLRQYPALTRCETTCAPFRTSFAQSWASFARGIGTQTLNKPIISFLTISGVSMVLVRSWKHGVVG